MNQSNVLNALPDPLSQQFLYELKGLDYLEVSRPEAKKLLQGQLTCQLDDVTTERASFGAQCNNQGRVLSLFQLFLYRDNYYLQLPSDMVELALSSLKKYAGFYKVKLQSIRLEKFSLSGIGIESIIQQKVGVTLPEHTLGIKPYGSGIIVKLPGDIPHYEFINTGVDTKIFLPFVTLGDENIYHILTQQPMITSATHAMFLPQELNLQNLGAISFSKGCYTGQEIIARLHYRSKINFDLSTVSSSTTLLPGQDVFCAKQCVGKIIQVAAVSKLNLALVTTKHPYVHQPLFLDAENTLPLNVVATSPLKDAL